MRHYEVLISDKANEDMEAIYTYICKTFSAPMSATKNSELSEAPNTKPLGLEYIVTGALDSSFELNREGLASTLWEKYSLTIG